MKFYRMDSDQPAWKVWDDVRDIIDKRAFHFAKALYHDFYGLLADEYDRDAPAPWLEIRLGDLASSLAVSKRRAAEMLVLLAEFFDFAVLPASAELPPVDMSSWMQPSVHESCFGRYMNGVTADTLSVSRRIHVFYPIFLKKQGRASRDGDGKFTPPGNGKGHQTKSYRLQNKRTSPQSPLLLQATDLAARALGAVRRGLPEKDAWDLIGPEGKAIIESRYDGWLGFCQTTRVTHAKTISPTFATKQLREMFAAALAAQGGMQ